MLKRVHLLVQGQVLVAGASNIQATEEDCCQACWMYGGRPHNFTDARMGRRARPLAHACAEIVRLDVLYSRSGALPAGTKICFERVL